MGRAASDGLRLILNERLRGAGKLTARGNLRNMRELALRAHLWGQADRLQDEPPRPLVAPSFNGRTADSGSAYRGSNPWGAAKTSSKRVQEFPQSSPIFFARPWLALQDSAPHAGRFLWSGADYLGEAHVWP